MTGTAPRARLLLGADPGVVRSEQVSPIERGSTLPLYPDGLVERRDEVFDEGVELLGHALAVLVAVRLRLPDGRGQPPT